MTFCLGIKVKEGLVAIADTRITAGSNVSIKKKITIQQKERHSVFIMTSGLRSVRDKVMHYFDDLVQDDSEYNKLYKVVNAFGDMIKLVAKEDKAALEKSGLRFNLNTIIGGQLKDDECHKLFLIYSEGNWVELDQDGLFVIIGNSTHGKTILNRALKSDFTIKQALKAGFLSFDSTRLSANDVDFPIDVAVYKRDSFKLQEHRYEENDLASLSKYWEDEVRAALERMPSEWIDAIEHN
ncbi:MAG: peptidase [Opitutaceae bacterium]|nr:peptidase [Cytophagales bacterium]